MDDRTSARRWALAALVTNVMIVGTGALVRLTGSGLGCPEWPRCVEGSVVPVPGSEPGWHQAIEFGNRLLSFVVLAAVVGALLAVRRWSGADRTAVRLGWVLVVGVLVQAVVGGITVRLDLDPRTVMLHFLLSMVLVATATALHARVAAPPPGGAAPPPLRRVALAVPAVAALVLALGTVVTAAGPHAGDPGTPRLDLPITAVVRLHSGSVYVVVALTVALLVLARRAGGGSGALARAAGVLLAVELAQGALGYWQYFNGVPVTAVLLHVLLACCFQVAAVRVALVATDDRAGGRAASPGPRVAAQVG